MEPDLTFVAVAKLIVAYPRLLEIEDSSSGTIYLLSKLSRRVSPNGPVP